MRPIAEMSPRFKARIASLLYLIIFLNPTAGIFYKRLRYIALQYELARRYRTVAR
jgi:hypothetical protein